MTVVATCLCPSRVDRNPECVLHGAQPPCAHCGRPLEVVRLHLFLGGNMVKRRMTLRCADEACQRVRELIAKRHAFDRGECG